jgi:hypothetical protein
MNGFLAGAALFALAPQATPTPSEVNRAADTSQRGSRESTAGIRDGATQIERDRARARVNSQARRNKKGSLERPAESAPQRNENPKAMGSGAPMTPVHREPRPEGRNYPEGARTQPDKQPSSSKRENEQQR